LTVMEAVLPETPLNSRRFSTRIKLQDHVCVYWSCAGKDDLSPIRNLSSGGLLIESPRRPVVGATARLDFLVPEGRIRAEAVIKRLEPDRGVAMKFTAVHENDRLCLAQFMKRLHRSLL
jgi:hypothetical protein